MKKVINSISKDKKTNFTFTQLFFGLLFFISLLGYIPTMPYWLYNIGTFITVPIFLFFILASFPIHFSLNELSFFLLFLVSILLSYLFSNYGFFIAGFLRALVPIIFYYLTRILNIKKSKFFYDVLFILLLLAFLVASIQFLFLPKYILESDGTWSTTEEDGLLLLKRPVSYFGNANVFGVFSIFTFVILFIENNINTSVAKKIIIVLLVIFNVILFSKSRTSMLALILIVTIYNYRLKNYKVLFFFILGTLGLISFIILNFEKFLFLDNLFRLSALNETEDNSYTLRKNIAEFAYSQIIKNPIFGIGPGNEYLLMTEVHAPHKGMESASLLMLEERGILGFLFYLYTVIYNFLATKNFVKIVIGIVIFSVDFSETVCVLPQLTTFLAIFLAVSKNEQLSKSETASIKVNNL